MIILISQLDAYNSDTNYSFVDITLGSIRIFRTYICNVSMALVSRLADYPDTLTFILYAVICTKVCIKISLVL